jgi:hypothetical protein
MIKQRITDVERYLGSHGRITWLERLACGHTGQGRRYEADIRRDIAAGRQRVCRRCSAREQDHTK